MGIGFIPPKFNNLSHIQRRAIVKIESTAPRRPWPVCAKNSEKLPTLNAQTLKTSENPDSAPKLPRIACDGTGLLVTTIKVELFDKASGPLGPALELTIDPQKRVQVAGGWIRSERIAKERLW